MIRLFAEATSTGDPLSWLQAYGPFGVVLGLVLMGWLVPKSVVDTLREELDRMRVREEKVLDAISASARSVEQATAAITEVKHLMDDIRAERRPRRPSER